MDHYVTLRFLFGIFSSCFQNLLKKLLYILLYLHRLSLLGALEFPFGKHNLLVVILEVKIVKIVSNLNL